MPRLPWLLAVLVLSSLAAGCLGGQPKALDPGHAADAVAQPLIDPIPVVADLRARILDSLQTGAPVRVSSHPISEILGRYQGLGPASEQEVVLKPGHVLSPATWAEVDDARVPLPFVEVYEGHVKDKPDQLVRLTITNEWARGSIRVDDAARLIRMGLNGNLPFGIGLPPSTSSGSSTDAEGEWTPPASFDPPGWNDDDEDCLLLVPPYVVPMTDLGRTTKPAVAAKIVLDGDAQFARRLGNHSFPVLVAMLNEVDSIYEHEVGVRFQVVGLHLNTNEKYYPDPAKDAPLEKMAEYWNKRPDVDRDLVHLVTGYPSGYAQANCIGGAGQPELAYTFTPLDWERNTLVFHTNAMAHEVGHIFSAHHHYGNHVETGSGATIMIQGYTPGIRPVFGTVEKSVIRGWAEKHVVE